MSISEQQQRSDELLSSSIVQRQNLLDVLDRILDKGIVINGEIIISLLKTEVLSLRINLVIASIETAKRYGLELPWEKWQDSNKRLQVKEHNDQNKDYTTKRETGNRVKRVKRVE
jgi:Gas vesicle protein